MQVCQTEVETQGYPKSGLWKFMSVFVHAHVHMWRPEVGTGLCSALSFETQTV